MRVLRSCLALLCLALGSPGHGQEPPLRILVGFPSGGESDLIARILAEGLRSRLGVPVVVDNRPGGSGVVAAEALKNAAPDGNTLMVSPMAVTVFAPLTHARLRYDPVKDFAAVSLVASFQMAFAVGPGSAAKSLREYLEIAKTNPSQASYGVPIAGGPTHFLGAMLARASGVDLAVVPYKGSAPLVNDLLAGHVPAAITVVSQVIKHHEAGKLRLLATSGPTRSPLSPEVPTFRELGFNSLVGVGWQAVHTTAGAPREKVERIATAIADIVRSPQVTAQFQAMGREPAGISPDELARRMAEDSQLWAPAIRASGFRADQ